MSTAQTLGHTHCIRCGRALRAASSRSAGAGRWCRAKIRAAMIADALKGFTQAQAGKARELIDDGGIVAIREGIYRVAASNGSDFYSVAVTGQCSCAAGVHGRACYHWAAARVMQASVAR